MTHGRWAKALIRLAVIVLTSYFLVPAFSPAKVLAASNCPSLLATSNSSLNSSQLQQKKICLQQQYDQSQQQLNQANQQASDLQATIGGIDNNISSTTNQISNTEDQIQTTTAIINSLATDIGTTEVELADLTTKLDNAYRNLYELSQTSTIEMVINSNSIGDLLNQTQYIQSIQTDLKTSIDKANALKADLETKKKESEDQKASLVALNDQLTSSKNSLNYQRSQKNYLLQQTQGQQSLYQSLISKLSSQIETVSQAEYAARLRESSNGGETITGGTGGYPWPNADPNGIDPWLYYYRQCTSFGAWKFQAVFGVPFNDTRPGQGSAWNWPALAGDQGYHTSSAPRANAIVSWPINRSMNMNYGHVAWVTAVNGDGTINVAEYNWTNPLAYDQRTNVTPSRYGNATYIYP